MSYDRFTRLLHALIAIGITAQMLVSLVMVYPKPNRLPNAWWEVHEYLGLGLLAVLAAHWLWSLTRAAAAGQAMLLLPWFSAARLQALAADTREMLGEVRQGRLPHAEAPRPVAAAIQGLGLLIASFLAVTGAVLYLGMAENGAMAPALRVVKEAHEVAGPAMWAYLTVHPLIGILHQLAGHKSLSRMFRP